jgi:flavin-dependent dehydrogenase
VIEECFEVAILGGGPAGSATAVALARQGLRVVLCEKTLVTPPRFGEMLPPPTANLLQELGLWDAFVGQGHLASPGTIVSWGSEELFERDFLFNAYGCAWHLDRARFDELLLSEARKVGATVIRGADMAELQQRRARFVVDATGRRALIARNNKTRRITTDHLTAFGCLYPESVTQDRRLLVEAAENGWWYSVLLPQNRLLAVYLTTMGEVPRSARMLDQWWDAQMERTRHIRHRVKGFHSAMRVASAGSTCLERIATEHWLAVGDAASTYDPLSAQGISKALEGGLRAAEAIGAYLSGGGDSRPLHSYEQWVLAQYAEYLQTRRHFYNAETRWVESSFWASRR